MSGRLAASPSSDPSPVGDLQIAGTAREIEQVFIIPYGLRPIALVVDLGAGTPDQLAVAGVARVGVPARGVAGTGVAAAGQGCAMSWMVTNW